MTEQELIEHYGEVPIWDSIEAYEEVENDRRQ